MSKSKSAPVTATPEPERPTESPTTAIDHSQSYAVARQGVQVLALAQQESRPINHRALGELRAGVDSGLRDHASLVELLIGKDLFTREEYLAAAATGMEKELSEARQRNATVTPRFV